MSLRDGDVRRGVGQNRCTIREALFTTDGAQTSSSNGSKGQKVNTILVAATLLLTVSLAMVLGLACAYAAVYGILRAMGHRPMKQQLPPAAPVVQTS